MELDIVTLSRLQFALTAMYHFLFVPLTLGLSLLLAIMETVYVMTMRPIWRQMTKFWGTLFGINFALGVATGITMEFEFGMNWSYFSHYVGDIFGAPLAIEGLMAFFLEATFVGLFFFGWDKLSPRGHLATTWAVAIGSNLSALWILIANGWMQHPVGAAFNPQTMRMEITDFYAVLFNEVAQNKFVHTVSAGYVTASMFVLGISAWYLLRGRHVALARRSMAVAASFGLASALSVAVLGDESGYTVGEHQKMKIAALEAMWHTEPAPAGFTLIGFPDQAARETRYVIRIPYVLGLIATRSLTTEVPGIFELVESAKGHIAQGVKAYDALVKIRAARGQSVPDDVKRAFEDNGRYLGYAYLLKRYVDDPAAGDARADRQGGLGYGADGGAAVLVLQADGGPRLLLHRSDGHVLLARLRAPARALPLAAAAGLLLDPAAVACRGARLVRRRVRPPALDHRGRAADGHRRVRSRRVAGGADHLRLRAVLLGAGGGRGGAARQVHQARSAAGERNGRRPATSPRGVAP